MNTFVFIQTRAISEWRVMTDNLVVTLFLLNNERRREGGEGKYTTNNEHTTTTAKARKTRMRTHIRYQPQAARNVAAPLLL